MNENIQVRAEATPNPQTLRFVTNLSLTESPRDFKSVQETSNSPLARKLFGFPWTAGVFIGKDFVAITKQEWVDWETLADPLSDLILEHLERGEPVLLKIEESSPSSSSEIESEEIKLIKKVLDEEIRPAVAMDGGDILFHKFEDGIVYLFMKGACSGCPSSTMTLKMGIETRLMQALPNIREVVAM